MDYQTSNEPIDNNGAVDELLKVNKLIYEKNAELVTRNRTLSALRGIYEIINLSLGINDATKGIVGKITDALNLQFGAFVMIDEKREYLDVISLICSSFDETTNPFAHSSLIDFTVAMNEVNNSCVSAILRNEIIFTKDLASILKPGLTDDAIHSISEALKVNTYVLYPISFASKIIGLIILGSTSSLERFSPNDEEILNEIIRPIGIAIENAKLYTKTIEQVRQLESKNHELQTIFDVTNQIVTTLDPKEVSQRAVDLIPKETGFLGAIIHEYDLQAKLLLPIAITRSSYDVRFQSLIATSNANLRFDLNDEKFSDCSTVLSFQNDQMVISDDFKKNCANIFTSNSEELFSFIKVVASFPIKLRNKVMGVVTYLLNDKKKEELTQDDFDLMQTFAFQIGIGLDNAKLFSIYQDLTQSLAKKNKELEQYSQKEKDILDILGHELRTPITIVRNSLSFINMLKAKGMLDEDKLNHYLEMAVRSTKREIDLIETMLQATKIEANKIEIFRTKVSPNEVVQEGLEGVIQDAKIKGLEVEFVPTDVPEIYADRTRIQEIVNNLLTNAVKYTHQGKINISIRKLDENEVIFEFRDTGEGIPEDDIKKLGTKFYRVSQHINENETAVNVVRPGGTGLGLYVTFEFIKMQGGTVDVKSKVGEGSVFSFTIPIYNGQPIEEKKKTYNLLEKRQEKVPTDQSVSSVEEDAKLASPEQ